MLLSPSNEANNSWTGKARHAKQWEISAFGYQKVFTWSVQGTCWTLTVERFLQGDWNLNHSVPPEEVSILQSEISQWEIASADIYLSIYLLLVKLFAWLWSLKHPLQPENWGESSKLHWAKKQVPCSYCTRSCHMSNYQWYGLFKIHKNWLI